LRERAGFKVDNLGAPIDILWFRISRRDGDTAETFGHMEAGMMLVMLNRNDYWQCAYVIPKGGIDRVKAKGLPAFLDSIAFMSPFLRDRFGEIKGWDDVKLLTVAVDRLPRWHKPGLLCIGDAAHAMSPVGGVGINLAVQDAVATARLLAGPLLRGSVRSGDLARIHRRRWLPTVLVQGIQRILHRSIVRPAIQGRRGGPPAPVMAILNRFPGLRFVPAYLIGIGFAPERAPGFARRST
jgi:2-polyprenyl-6-methoxyphenol hydroxylase-like FAD-dependent oxidoreductase